MKQSRNLIKFFKIETAVSVNDGQIRRHDLGIISNMKQYYKLLDKQKKLSILKCEIYDKLTLFEKEYLFSEFGYDIY